MAMAALEQSRTGLRTERRMSMSDDTLSAAYNQWRWKILVSTFVGYVGFYLTREIFPVVKTTLAKEWGFVDEYGNGIPGHVAPIWAAYYFAYMVGQFLVSAIGRRTGARILLLGGLGASIAVNVICGTLNSPRTFMLFMVVNGLLQATGWPGCVGTVAEWLRPHGRGFIMGVWSTNLLVGTLMVKFLAGWLLHWTWRYSYFGCALLALAVWALLLFWQRNQPEDVNLRSVVRDGGEAGRAVAVSNALHIPFAEYLRLARHPLVVMMAVGYFSVKFLRYSATSWLPSFLELHTGLSKVHAAYYSTMFELGGLPGMILAGWAFQRWFRGNWAALCVIGGVGAVAGYGLINRLGADPWAVALCFGFVGFMLYVSDSLLKGVASVEVAGERNGIAVAGLVNGVASAAPVLQELVIGQGMKGPDPHANFHYAMRVSMPVAILYVLTMAATVWLLRRHQAASRNRRVGPDADSL